jgi:small-conductance mechanosensitive channel
MQKNDTESVLSNTFNSLVDGVTHPIVNTEEINLSIATISGFILIIVLAWWGAARIESLIQRVTKGQNYGSVDSSTIYLLGRLTRYVIWLLATIIGLNYMGFDLSTLAFLGGAVGIGIGFGLQNIFSNFISGIIIISEKTLKIGDSVELTSGVFGEVKEIGLRYTRITTRDNIDIIVPNSEFINGQVTNWSYSEKLRRIHIPFGIAYGCDKEEVKEAAFEAAKRVKGAYTSSPVRQPEVWLVGFGASSLNFELVVWVDNDLLSRPGKANALFLWELESELRKRNIEIPFPQRDLNLRSGHLEVDLQNAKVDVESKKE